MPLIDSFIAPGYPGNGVDDQVHPQSVVNDTQPATPAYQIPPVFVMLGIGALGFLLLIWLLGEVQE